MSPRPRQPTAVAASEAAASDVPPRTRRSPRAPTPPVSLARLLPDLKGVSLRAGGGQLVGERGDRVGQVENLARVHRPDLGQCVSGGAHQEPRRRPEGCHLHLGRPVVPGLRGTDRDVGVPDGR